MQHLIDLIDRWRSRRILVVGDFMLDQYVYGDAERLSPDAPVPVLAVEREEHIPGGASNVCAYLQALRCRTICVGLTGRDAAAERLREQLSGAGCETSGLIADVNRRTTVKRSYIGLAQHRHPQKMFRVDHESPAPVDAALTERLIETAAAAIPDADVLCIEDYNKGVISRKLCERLIPTARRHDVPVLVDPAAVADYARYRGATLITPNRTEAARAAGMSTGSSEQIETAARRILEASDLGGVVLTLDRHGALLLEREGEPIHIPTTARNVYDVTGAGDMVLATLAAARANGAAWKPAVELANVAAGLEVERFGVAPVPLEQIHLSVLQMDHKEAGKLRELGQLLPELAAHRKQGAKVAFTNGCFDIIHAGHIDLLRAARATADLLVLALNSDASIRALKGEGRPISAQDDRIKILSELQCVDYIVLFGDGSGEQGDTPLDLLRAIKPEVLIKGGDYQHHEIAGHEILQSYGGRVCTIPLMEGRSTTNIVEKIRTQRIER